MPEPGTPQIPDESILSEVNKDNLTGALTSLDLDRLHFKNAIYYLDLAGEIGLRDMLVEADIKSTIDNIRGRSVSLGDNYTEKILNFIRGELSHTPYNSIISPKFIEQLGQSNRPYYIALAKLIATGFELSRDSYFNASRLYRDYLGETEKSEILLAQARKEQEENINIKDSEKLDNLIEHKSEFMQVLSDFFQVADNDPSMRIDEDSVIREVKQEISKKLGLI